MVKVDEAVVVSDVVTVVVGVAVLVEVGVVVAVNVGVEVLVAVAVVDRVVVAVVVRVDVGVGVIVVVGEAVLLVVGDAVAVVVFEVVADVVAVVLGVEVPVVVCDEVWDDVRVVVLVDVAVVVADVLCDVLGVVTWQSTKAPVVCASSMLFIICAVSSHDARDASRKYVLITQPTPRVLPGGPVCSLIAALIAAAVAPHDAALPLSASRLSPPSVVHCTVPAVDGHVPSSLPQGAPRNSACTERQQHGTPPHPNKPSSAATVSKCHRRLAPRPTTTATTTP